MSTLPYYQDEWVTLYKGDCLEQRAWLEADVLITDPPYGVAFRSARRTETERFDAIAGDNSIELRDAALEAWGNRPALVFGTWRAQRPENVRQRLIWAKGEDPGLGDLSMPWGYGDEEVYVLGSGWVGERRTNVYRIPKVAHSANPGHPTPKPLPLMEALIEYAPAGLIADPFAGSGSTLIAARALGRKCIGVELNEKYCDLIVKRLRSTPIPAWFPEASEVRASGWSGAEQAFDFEALSSGQSGIEQ